MSFQVGDAVFLASAGLGRVTAFAGRDAAGRPAPLEAGAAPAFYVVDVEGTIACVPVTAAETLRPPVDAVTARAMLEVLRGPMPLPSAEPLLERGKQVVHSGTALEHAALLRELYGLATPLAEAFASGLAFLSKLVLPELALVLKVDLDTLRREMSDHYPAAREVRKPHPPV